MLWSVPGKVLNVRVTHVDSRTLNVAWDARRDVTLYQLRHWRLGGGDVTAAAARVNVTSSSNLTLAQLARDTEYSFQVDCASLFARYQCIQRITGS